MKVIKKIVSTLLVLFLFSLLTRNLVDYQKKLAFYQQTKSDYQQELKTNLGLKTRILRSKEKSHLEKTIRNKLGFLKKDEIALIIPQITPSPPVVHPSPLPNWQQWLKKFNLN